MTYIEKLFNDFGFISAVVAAVNYCRLHNIKYKWLNKDNYFVFSWLDPDDNEIHIKLSVAE